MSATFRTVYESDVGMSLRLEAVDFPSGPRGAYRHHRLVTSDGRVGAVVIAQSGSSILLVQSQRFSVGRDLWELPRGAGESIDLDSASPDIATALRELQEETGFIGNDPRLIGRYLTDSGVYPQMVAVIACAVDPERPRTETDGEIEKEWWVSVSEVSTLVRDGVIEDAHSLAALALWMLEGCGHNERN